MVVLGAQILLAAVFAVAGAAKLRNLPAFADALRAFGIAPRLRPVLALALALTEVGIAIALVVPVGAAAWAAGAALALLTLFSGVMVRTLALGRRPPCNCFGQLATDPVGPVTLARNAGLACAAGLVIWAPAISLGTVELVALGAAVVIGAQGWFSLQLLRQNGRTLARIAELEQLSAPVPGPTQPGARAADFVLTGIDGTLVTLRELLGRGRPVLLVFAHSGCGACGALMPRVADWQRTNPPALTVAVIAEGDVARHRAQAAEHRLGTVLMAPDGESARLFGVTATPAAVLIDEQGVLSSDVALGADAIEALVAHDAPSRVSASPVSRAVAATATVSVAGLALASSSATAQARDPQRDAILAVLASAENKLLARAHDLQRSMHLYSSTVPPRSARRRATLAQVARSRREYTSVRSAVTGVSVTTVAATQAQRLVLESLALHDRSLARLASGLRVRSGKVSGTYFKQSRALFDQALQRGVDAKAALKAP